MSRAGFRFLRMLLLGGNSRVSVTLNSYSVRSSQSLFPCALSQGLFPCALSQGLFHALFRRGFFPVLFRRGFFPALLRRLFNPHFRVECYLREKKHFKTFFSWFDKKGSLNVWSKSFCTINYYSVSLENITTSLGSRNIQKRSRAQRRKVILGL